ncbi:hypothetical protein JHK86_045005 [Glycine max]|nr:hypothetical protein JHK86_045005 [Glycine max]
MQSLQGLGLPSIMSMEELDAQVAWPGDQPSSFGGGEASTAQELDIEEPPTPTPAEEETTSDQIQPYTPVTEPEQSIQDLSATPALDLNEDQPQEEQDNFFYLLPYGVFPFPLFLELVTDLSGALLGARSESGTEVIYGQEASVEKGASFHVFKGNKGEFELDQLARASQILPGRVLQEGYARNAVERWQEIEARLRNYGEVCGYVPSMRWRCIWLCSIREVVRIWGVTLGGKANQGQKGGEATTHEAWAQEMENQAVKEKCLFVTREIVYWSIGILPASIFDHFGPYIETWFLEESEIVHKGLSRISCHFSSLSPQSSYWLVNISSLRIITRMRRAMAVLKSTLGVVGNCDTEALEHYGMTTTITVRTMAIVNSPRPSSEG